MDTVCREEMASPLCNLTEGIKNYLQEKGFLAKTIYTPLESNLDISKIFTKKEIENELKKLPIDTFSLHFNKVMKHQVRSEKVF